MPKKDGSPTAAEQRAYEAATAQFPSVDGNESVEIATRSQDEDRLTAEVHRKKFVVLASAWGTTEQEPAHRRNIEATRQAMIGQGLRPTGDGRFVGEEEHPDGASLVLTYEVPCTPAVIVGAETPTVTHAAVTLDDQHDLEADSDTGTADSE